MSSPGQWEVVKSNRNKNNPPNKNAPNNTKQKNKNNSVLTKPTGAVIQESKTLYDIFLEQSDDPQLANGTKAKNGKTKKTAAEKRAAKKPTCIEEALQQLSPSEVERELNSNRARYPTDPIIWLKEMCHHLNQQLNYPTPDPVYTDKPSDYPLCNIPPEVYKLISDTLQSMEVPQLISLLDYLLSSMVADMNKDLQAYGYRLVIQCLLKIHPSLVLNVIPKCRDLKNSYQNRHLICLSLLWAVGQAGFHDLNVGLKVWLELMMDLTGLKAYNKYVVSHLDSLLRYHQDATSCKSLGVKELFSILDYIYASSPGPAQQLIIKGLQGLYPKLKRLSYGPTPQLTLHNYFPSYLVRLKPSASQPLKHELYASLMECLELDAHCYSAWRQLYTKNMVQSSLLLQNLVKKKDILPRAFPRKHLMETLRTFQVTNEELGTSKKSKLPEGLSHCKSHCQVLLSGMASSWKMPWRGLFRLLLLASLSVLIYDVYLHGGFHHSKTGRFLTEVGAVSASQQAWARLQVYTAVAVKWGGERYEEAKPHLHKLWDQLSGVREMAWTYTETLRVKIPPYLAEARSIAEKVSVWAWARSQVLWKIVATNLAWLQGYVSQRLDHVLTGDLAPEKLHLYALDTLTSLQHLISRGYQWLVPPTQ